MSVNDPFLPAVAQYVCPTCGGVAEMLVRVIPSASPICPEHRVTMLLAGWSAQQIGTEA